MGMVAGLRNIGKVIRGSDLGHLGPALRPGPRCCGPSVLSGFFSHAVVFCGSSGLLRQLPVLGIPQGFPLVFGLVGIPQGFPRRSVLDSLPLTDFVGLVGTLVAFATSGCRPDEPYKGETGVVGNPPTLLSALPCVLTLSTLLVASSSLRSSSLLVVHSSTLNGVRPGWTLYTRLCSVRLGRTLYK